MRRVVNYSGHSDRSSDSDGADVVVVTNSADPNPIPNCPNSPIKVRLLEGSQQCLRPLDWSLAVHISCNNVGRGWCLVSTYSGNTPGSFWPASTGYRERR